MASCVTLPPVLSYGTRLVLLCQYLHIAQVRLQSSFEHSISELNLTVMPHII